MKVSHILLLLCVCFAGVAQGSPYIITDLGVLPGGSTSYATGINNMGQVVGYSSTSGGALHGFIYSDGSMKDIGTLGGSTSIANAVNDNGDVVGYSTTSNSKSHAFLYSNGAMKDLEVIGRGLGGSASTANAINNAGTIVGAAITTTGANHAYFYTNGNMIDITPSSQFGYAVGINNSGQITGATRVYDANGNPKSSTIFLFSDVVMSNLGDGEPNYITQSGSIVGWNVGNVIAYSNGTFRTLGGGTGLAMNDAGLIVGERSGSAFYSTNYTIHDLVDLIDAKSGWSLKLASCVNNSGQIVGYGINPAGKEHAFLLTPVPEPASLIVICVVGSLILIRRRSH